MKNEQKSSSGIRNREDEEAIYPKGDNILHKTKEDIRPLPKAARPDQTKKSDTRYVGESSKGVEKTKRVDENKHKKDND